MGDKVVINSRKGDSWMIMANIFVRTLLLFNFQLRSKEASFFSSASGLI